MLQGSLDNYFIITAFVVGLIAILINWFYIVESVKGIYITEHEVLKKYVNLPFMYSTVMMAILWVTTNDLDIKLLNYFKLLTLGWIITILASLIISGVAKTSIENKKNIRRIVKPCTAKTIVLLVILWLVY